MGSSSNFQSFTLVLDLSSWIFIFLLLYNYLIVIVFLVKTYYLTELNP